MVISLTNQLKVSQGDYARTIESASNEIRIMQEQWDRLSRAVGNVFYPILQGVLPYINGILMALTEVFNLIASLAGFEMPEFDYSTLSGMDDTTLDLIDNLNGAGASVDDLNNKMKGLRNFDKLNVITTPTNNASSISSGSIDPKILQGFNLAFEEYDDLMDSVRMKAHDIRDSILEWLGFSKELNPITGEIEWKYQGLDKTLSNMWNSFADLPLGVKVLVGGMAAKNIVSLGQAFSKSISGMNKYKSVLIGTVGAITSFVGMRNSINGLIKTGDNAIDTLGAVASGLGAVASGALIGTKILPGWGTVIGVAAGGLLSLVSALTSYENTMGSWDSILNPAKDNLDAFTKSLDEQLEKIQIVSSAQMAQTTVHERLVEELQRITDENGKVKKGYEERANFIINELNNAYGTEMKLIDGTVDKYQQSIDKIKELISVQKQQIYTDMAKEMWETAEKNRAKAEDEYNSAIARQKTYLQQTGDTVEGINKSIREIEEALRTGAREDNEYAQKQISELNRRKQVLIGLDNDVEKASKNLSKIQRAEMLYQGVVTATLEGNAEQIAYYEKEIGKAYNNISTGAEESYIIMARASVGYFNSTLENFQTTYGQMTNEQKIWADNTVSSFVQTFTDEVQKTKEITPEMVAAWKEMSTLSTDAFLVAFNQLPDDLKNQLMYKLEQTGFDLSNSVQKGVNKTGGVEIPIKFTESGKQVKGFFFSQYLKENMQAYGLASYATGGLPPVGQLFIANEKGPELVSQIGGQSFVANQNQISDFIDRKTNSSSSRSPQIFNLYLDANHKLGSYTLEQMQQMAISNGGNLEFNY